MHPVETKTTLVFKILRLFLLPLLVAACLAVFSGPARAIEVGLDLTGGGTATVAAGDTTTAAATASGSDSAYGAELGNGATLDNSGTASANSSSGSAYGVIASFSMVTNSGTISANSSSGSAYGVWVANSGSSLTNSGTISAMATGGGTAYAIYASSGSTINLKTGTQILSGSVYGDSNGDLTVTSDSDLGFELAGRWSNITHSGAGTWTLSSGSTARAFNLTLNSGSTLAMATDTNLTVTGTATLNGSLLVDASAADIGTTTLLTAGTLNTGTGYSTGSCVNPNFSTDVTTTTGANGSVSVTTSFTPQDDASSLAATAALSSAQAFAGVAQARSLTMLADSGQDNDEPIMVAANGTLAGLLDPQSPDEKWSMFLQPVFSSASRDATDGAGYDALMSGLEAGIDRRYGDNWVLGAMVGIGTGTIDFNGSDFVDNDSEDQTFYTAGIYGGYRMDDWVFTDTLSVTYATHESDRYAGLGETATADYDSWLIANQFLAVYKWHPSEQWEIAPRAGLNISHLYRESFSESGATNAVSYDDLNKTFADAILGVRATHEGIQVEHTLITPYAGLGLIHSLGSGDITVRQYLTSAAAEVTTDNDDNRLTTECGVTFGFGTTSLTLAYNGEYGETTTPTPSSAPCAGRFRGAGSP